MRAMTTWVPRRGAAVRDILDRDLDEVFARFFGNENSARQQPQRPTDASWAPPVETLMRDGEYVVRMDLPGVDAADVDVSVENNVLLIRGQRRDHHEEAKGDRFYREVSYGSFARGVKLPPRTDAESIKASYKDGVLEVTVKVAENAGARKIPIATP